MANQAYAFKTSYTVKLNSLAVDNYNEYFASIGVPSASKIGVVFDICHAYPFMNGNYQGFTADVLRTSYKTFINSPIDINHERGSICGTIVNAELIEDGTAPLTVRLVAVLYRDILKQWGIEDLMNEDWSMECLFSNVLYTMGNKVYKPEDVPEIDAQFSDLMDGKPVFDQYGNRVGTLLGGSDKVDFNGCGLIIWGSGADPLAETHLQVANNKNQEGVNQDLNTYTEEQMNQAKAELQEQIDKLKSDLETAQASLNEVNEKLSVAEAGLAGEKERADKAEADLKVKVDNERFESRKSALASKNLTYRTEKEDFIRTSSDDSFNDWVADLEATASATAKSYQQAKANDVNSQAFASLSLTAKGDEVSANSNTNEDVNVLI